MHERCENARNDREFSSYLCINQQTQYLLVSLIYLPWDWLHTYLRIFHTVFFFGCLVFFTLNVQMFWLHTNHFQVLAKLKLLLPLISEPDFPQVCSPLSLLCISVPLSLADHHFLSSLTEIRDTKRIVSKRAKAEMYSIKLNSPEDLLNLLFNPVLVIFLSNDSVS